MSGPVLTVDQFERRAARLPRVDLAHLPTPIEEAPRFADEVGPVRIFIKRDDCTGLLFGGNKTRHNEFLMADALYQNCDMVVWGAGLQSNNCRQTAAACAKLGLECRLYLTRLHYDTKPQGNLLLDHLVGAKVEIVDKALGDELTQYLTERAEEFRAAGRRPYHWNPPRVVPLAAVSYALCMAEINQQMHAMGLKPDVVYVSSAGATGAGLALGKAVLGMDCGLRSICPIGWPWDVRESMAEAASQAATMLGLPHRLKGNQIDATEDYIGHGYGERTPEAQEALRLLATTEGILLDPVYTAKAMAAVVDDVRSGRVAPGSVVVFVHTGGLPVVFALAEEVLGG